MKNDYDNIEINQKLKSRTIRAAGVALHKKRFRFITASSLAAVVCAVVAVFLALGGEPVPDVVVENSPEATSHNYTDSSEEWKSLQYARSRHVKILELSELSKNYDNSDEITTIDFSETPTFVSLLDNKNVIQELAEYGFSVELPTDDTYQDHIYYIVAFHSPSYQYRYNNLGIKLIDEKYVLEYISIDHDPIISEEYGLSRPADDGAKLRGYLVIMPASSIDTPFTALNVSWNDLSDAEKTETVIDTVLIHEDLESILDVGVEKSLSYELAILKNIGEPAINHLREYYSTPIEGGKNNGMDIARYMLYNLLNDYQLETYDAADPLQAVEKELLSYALSEKDNASDSLVIPETYVFALERGEKSAELVLYSAIYTFTPPLAPTYKYQAVRTYLDKTDVGNWEVNLIYTAETSDEVLRYMEEYYREISDIDNTFIKSEMLADALQRYNLLTGENMSTDMQEEYLTIDLNAIKTHLASRYGEINSTYPALSRDMFRYILDENSNDDTLQIANVYPLSEDFDNPITAAVLAVTYDGTQTEGQVPKLYVVKAEYDKSRWALKDITVDEKQMLSMDDFPKLRYRGFYEVYETLFDELTREVIEINKSFGVSLPLPVRDEDNLSGGYLDLGMESGVSRFVNVSRFIRPEEDYGCMIPLWYAEDNPADLSYSAFAKAVNNADWTQINEEDQGRPYSATELGFIGYSVNIDLQNENGLYQFKYTFDTLKNRVLLTIVNRYEQIRCYEAIDAGLCAAGIETFSIDTDVSEYMITEEKGPTLPDYREELRYLTPIVGDMPGGIISVEAAVSSELAAGGLENSMIDGKDGVIDWAQAVGGVIESNGIVEIRQTPLMGTPSVVWDVVLAAQEGVGKLQITGYADTGTVYIRKTYRLYGSPEAHEQYFVSESPELFDTLCELSFKKTLRD